MSKIQTVYLTKGSLLIQTEAFVIYILKAQSTKNIYIDNFIR